MRKPCCRRTELSSKVSISTSAPDIQRLEEGDPLWNRANINVPAVLPGDICVLRTAERKRQVYMSQRQINVTTNPGALSKNSVTPSFHFQFTARGLAQGWFLILVFQSSLFTTPQHSAMPVRPQHRCCGWRGRSHGSPRLPGGWIHTSGPFLSPRSCPCLAPRDVGSDTSFRVTGMLLKMLFGDSLP